MNLYRGDIHIHSVLSPCADLGMSPVNIVAMARERNLHIIAVTDHNATLHGPLVRRLASDHGIMVLLGAEVTTREEVHCLCLFEAEEHRDQFQAYIEANIQRVANKPDVFGYQVVVNERDEILHEIEYLLHASLSKGIDEVERMVHSLGGLFIPAHVERPKYSITSQLGFVPANLNYDALEISDTKRIESFVKANPMLPKRRFISNSDSHWPDRVGSVYTGYRMKGLTFDEFKMAIRGEEGRNIVLQ